MSEKTEDPTDKKIRDSRKKGQVAVSQDVTKLLSCAMIFSMLFALQDVLMSSGKDILSFTISKTNTEFVQAAGEVFTKVFGAALGTAIAVVGVALATKIIGTWMQTGPMFASEAMKMDFNKLNPVNQAKNIFSMKKIYEMINNIFKAGVLGYVFYILIQEYFSTLILLPTGDLDMTWKSSNTLFKSAITISLVILLVMSVFDFSMQKYFHMKTLKMSIDEVKREYKESEGDPHMKGQLSAIRQEVLEGDPEDVEGNVKQADAIVVNPTHYAVALYYRPNETPLPKILCKGYDDKAKQIIEYARKYDKPIIRYVWLARTLYAHKGQYIPKPTLQAVAAIYQTLKPILEEQDESENQYDDDQESGQQDSGQQESTNTHDRDGSGATVSESHAHSGERNSEQDVSQGSDSRQANERQGLNARQSAPRTSLQTNMQPNLQAALDFSARGRSSGLTNIRSESTAPRRITSIEQVDDADKIFDDDTGFDDDGEDENPTVRH